MQLGSELNKFFFEPSQKQLLTDGKSILFSNLTIQTTSIAVHIFKCVPATTTAGWSLFIPMVTCRRSSTTHFSKLQLQTDSERKYLEDAGMNVLKQVGIFFKSWVIQLNKSWTVAQKTPLKISVRKKDCSIEKYLLILNLAKIVTKKTSPKFSTFTHKNQQINIYEHKENIKKIFLCFLKFGVGFRNLENKLKSSSFAWLSTLPQELHSIIGQWTTIEEALKYRLICKATSEAFIKFLHENE